MKKLSLIFVSFYILINGLSAKEKLNLSDKEGLGKRIQAKINNAIKINKKVDRNGVGKKNYLIEDFDDIPVEAMNQRWANGGISFVSEEFKTRMNGMISGIKTKYSSNPVQIYVYTARYLVDYRVVYDGAETAASEDEWMEKKLKEALTKNGGLSVGMNSYDKDQMSLNLSSQQEFDSKRFRSFIDGAFNEVHLEVDAMGEKALVLFYIETIHVRTGERTLQNGQKEKFPLFDLDYYSFLWGDKLNLEHEKDKVNGFREFMQNTFPDFKFTIPFSNIQNDPARQTYIEKCIAGIDRLWGEEGDNFSDPDGFERLKLATENEKPEWAKGITANQFEEIRLAITDHIVDENNYYAYEYFNGHFATTEEGRARIFEDAKRMTLVALQELWISEHFDNLGSLYIGGQQIFQWEEIIPLWSSGKRAYYYYQIGKGTNYPGMKFDTYLKMGVSIGLAVFDAIPFGRVAAIVKNGLSLTVRAGRVMLQKALQVLPTTFLSKVRNTITYAAFTSQMLLGTELRQTLYQAAEQTLIIETKHVPSDVSKLAAREAAFIESSQVGFGMSKTQSVKYLTNATITEEFATVSSSSIVREVEVNIVKYTKSGIDDVFALSILAENRIIFFSIINQDVLQQQFGKNFDGLVATPPTGTSGSGQQQQCTTCTVREKETCVLLGLVEKKGNNSLVAKNGVAILCRSSISNSNLNKVCEEILSTRFSSQQLEDFLKDISQPSAQNCSYPTKDLSLTVSSIKSHIPVAWNIFTAAGRNCLKEGFTHLTKLGEAAVNRRLSQAPYSFTLADYTAVAYAAGQQGSLTRHVDDNVFDLLLRFSQKNYEVEYFERIKSNLKNSSVFKTCAGANWVLEYMVANSDEFQGKKIRFEQEITIDDEGSRVADLVVIGAGNINYYYEFKTVQMFTDGYVDQLILDFKRPDVSILNQLQWIFDGTKISETVLKQQLVSKLKLKKNDLNTMSSSKKLIFFGVNDVTGGVIDDAVIDNFVNSNFSTFMKIK